MTKLNKLFVSKIFALLLTFLLFHGPYPWGHPAGEVSEWAKNNFAAALEEYQIGLYEPAAAKLELILELKEEVSTGLKAKVRLLLGACYEKSGKGDRAEECFIQLKKMLDQELIDQVPVVHGLDPESLKGYQKFFEEEPTFKFKKPVSVSEIMKKNVVYAPRKSLKEKEKEKKKKKFPWLIAVGAAVIIGVTAVLLLTQKDKNKKSEFPEIEWVAVPAGEFQMGDNFNEGDADEQPVHTVYLDEYHISKYEITYSQYDFFCEETGRKKPPDVFGFDWLSDERRGPFPVVSVSWDDAKAFCDWLSRRTGENIHLPTEAQWEKAARGIQQYRYPWGNSEPTCSKANYYGCGNYVDNRSELQHVGRHSGGTSPYGVHDMAGNVWEWCRDWYSSSYYSIAPRKNPQGPAIGSKRVIRGGGIGSRITDIRSANRDFYKSHVGHYEIGFRVTMEN